MKTASPTSRQVVCVGWVTAAAVYLLLLSEWLFLVTKPSMFTVVSWPQRGAILLAAAFVTAVPVVGLAVLLAWSWSRLAGRWRRATGGIALVVPAVVLSATGLLLVENFTKTVFGFNVGSFTSPIRYLYAIGWLLLAFRIHRSLAALIDPSPRRRGGALLAGMALILAASAFTAWTRYEPRQALDGSGASDAGKLPNILILSSDGLNAANMSVYGYDRSTTPFLDSRVDEFLISENHFSNSSDTVASIGALLTGQLPLQTEVLQAGDAFRGEPVFRHLPGLLRQFGYYNIDISARYYGDAYDMNIRQGFHVANGRSLRNETLPVVGWIGRAYPSEFYFVSLTLERLRQRFLHMVGIADMRDFFDVVAKKFTRWAGDDYRLGLLRTELSSARRPFFAHVHLLGTHNVSRPEAGRAPAADPYDDAVARFDGYVGEIVGNLEASAELDRTVLIINSDHDSNRTGSGPPRRIRVRLPLMIRFPQAERAGRIPENTQRIDIAPTILSYLGVEPPAWMMGRPLIDTELDPLRLILGTGLRRRRSVRSLSLVQCQQAWELKLQTVAVARLAVEGHTDPCAEEDLLGSAEARAYLLAQLESSDRLALPFVTQLESLRRDNDPGMRRRVARAIRVAEVPALWLGEAIAVTHAHSDLWTDGTRPAAILLRNDEREPRAFELTVRSGQKREFPASFFVQDGAGTREHVFSAPGSKSVDLGHVAPGSERLFLVWSARAWTAEGGRRQRGVRLSLSGTWLRGLLRDRQPSEWQGAARLILDRRVPTARLADDWLAANLYGDRWTRGSEPAGLAVRNQGAEPLARRLVVRSGKGHEFPLRVYLHDGIERREYVFERPGSMAIDLPEVPPRSERLFVIRSAGGWTPDSRTRELGVRLSPG